MGKSKRTTGPSYNVWSMMKQRCTNPRAANYVLYGGRGITYDPRWESFDAFNEDMGEKPEGMTLERKNNELGYSKENCVWASVQEQNNNKRNTVKLTFNGETMSMKQWARKLGIPYYRVQYRLRQGYPIEKVLDPTPIVQHRRTVRGVDTKGNEVVFPSLAEAGRHFGSDQRTIFNAICRASEKFGHKWSYIDTETDSDTTI
jgi:hypothetical protein